MRLKIIDIFSSLLLAFSLSFEKESNCLSDLGKKTGNLTYFVYILKHCQSDIYKLYIKVSKQTLFEIQIKQSIPVVWENI